MSTPTTSGAMTRRDSSSSSCPVSSPSSTTIVSASIAAGSYARLKERVAGEDAGTMSRRGGWRRVGSRRAFRYEDSRGRRITDPDKIARIEDLTIPPAWRDVWISPRANAKLQATGVDKAGRRQYLYHPEFRAQQEQAKYDKLVRFAEKLPDLRLAMNEHMDLDTYEPERVCAIAVRLINLGWFRVGSDRYAKTSRTYGVTTLYKKHVSVRGSKLSFAFRSKHKVLVRTTLVDSELAG